MINLPAILDIPQKMLPMVTDFNNYRYLLAEGGRGGAKSQSIGRFLLFLGEQKHIRIVCGRETQNSIEESVYALLSDLIREHGLNYEILSNKIIHRETQTTFRFRGFREQGSFNIQGMEGVDIVWIDEAQAITKITLDRLIPTIRKDKAKIIFSMNRYEENDPAYVFCSGREDCLHININYMDNQHCTEALKNEAEECRKLSQDDYDHIWLGWPIKQGQDCVFSREDFGAERHIATGNYGLRIAGFDIARYGDDKSAVTIIEQLGALHWAVIHSEEWEKKDLNWTTGRILELHNDWKCDKSIIDEDGIGAGPLDTLTQGRQLNCFIGFHNVKYGINQNKYYANARTENAYKVKKLLDKGHLYIGESDNKKLIDEMCGNIRYTFDNYQRRILISKEQLRSKGIKSPNLADSLIMAISLIDEKSVIEDKYCNNNQPQYAKEGDLWTIAGV